MYFKLFSGTANRKRKKNIYFFFVQILQLEVGASYEVQDDERVQ